MIKNSLAKKKILSPEVLFFLPIIYLFLFHNIFNFNFKFPAKNYSWIGLLFPIAATYLVTFYLLKRKNTAYHLLFSVPVTAYLLLISYSETYSFNNERFITNSAIIYFLGVFFLVKRQNSNLFIYAFLLIFHMYEIILGVSQSLSGKGFLSISGSLENSNAYATYLVVNLPLSQFVISKGYKYLASQIGQFKSNKYFKITIAIFYGSVLYLVIQSKSRTALIVFSTLFFFWIFGILKKQYQRKQFTYFSAINFLTLLIGLFFFAIFYFIHSHKAMSTSGRTLLLNITMQNVNQSVWSGTGLGKFSLHFPEWQSQYIEANRDIPAEQLSNAGESYIILNEPLQVFMELGIFGFLMCCLLALLFFFLKTERSKPLLTVLKLSNFLILLGGVTSYTSHVNIIAFIFFLNFCVGFSIADQPKMAFIRKKLSYNFPKVITILILSSLLYSTVISTFEANYYIYNRYHWSEVTSNSINCNPEINNKYLLLSKYFYNDGKFLAEYGNYLFEKCGDYTGAIRVLEKSRKYFISRKSITDLADAYSFIENRKKAASLYQWLGNYLPNLFSPKYKLMNLYIKSGNIPAAKLVALSILKTPIKVKTNEVERIRLEAQLFLNSTEAKVRIQR